MISFEPSPAAFEQLQGTTSDPAWKGLQIGLGRADGEAQLTVAAQSVFSSFRTARAESARIDAGIVAVRQVTVPVRSLASLWNQLQLEWPFEPLYEGQALLGEVLTPLLARSFAVHALFEGARDQSSGALIEADVVLVNRRLAET